jgi:hypothetical protein
MDAKGDKAPSLEQEVGLAPVFWVGVPSLVISPWSCFQALTLELFLARGTIMSHTYGTVLPCSPEEVNEKNFQKEPSPGWF